MVCAPTWCILLCLCVYLCICGWVFEFRDMHGIEHMLCSSESDSCSCGVIRDTDMNIRIEVPHADTEFIEPMHI